jgi:hypothetical protein
MALRDLGLLHSFLMMMMMKKKKKTQIIEGITRNDIYGYPSELLYMLLAHSSTKSINYLKMEQNLINVCLLYTTDCEQGTP